MGRVPEIRSVEDFAKIYGEDHPDRGSVEEFLATYTSTYAPGHAIGNSWAQILHNPLMAKRMIDMSHYIVNEMAWAQQLDLREIAIQTLNRRHRCEYSHIAHFNAGLAAGLSAAQLASLDFPESKIWSDEQRLVIEFTNAVLDLNVSDELFERARALWGHRGMLEFVVTICYWSWWAIIINTLQPEMNLVPTDVPRVEVTTEADLSLSPR